MYWIDEAFDLIIVLGIFWLVGLVACMGIPVLFCHVFRIKVNLWAISTISAVGYIVGTYIWYNAPM